MATVLDYSAGRPSGAAVRGAGHSGVVRYIGTPGRTKNLTRAEFQDMDRQGVGVAVVYENHTGDAAGGYAAGQAAARAARADADAVGLSAQRPIYFAIDSDQVTKAQFDAAMAYLDGAASVLGLDRVGVYGEFDVIERAVGPHARYGWQTAAWSGGKRSSKAVLFQRIGTAVVGGIACDINDVLAADWGQHNAQEDDMPSAEELLNAAVIPNQVNKGRNDSLATLVSWTNWEAHRANDQLAGLANSVGQLTQLAAKGADVDEAALAKALEPAVTAAIAAKDFGTGTPEENAAAVKKMLQGLFGTGGGAQ